MNALSIRIGVDVGSTRHRVAVGLPDGKVLDEFDIDHSVGGFNEFFAASNPLKSVIICR